jgi:Fur family iron response transcriptional regulator
MGMDRHVTADDVAAMARKAGVRVSLATVYNTLNQFVAAGLMKRITLDTDRTYFDTNVSDHHHLFFEENGVLHDIPGDSIRVEGLPEIPSGSKVQLGGSHRPHDGREDKRYFTPAFPASAAASMSQASCRE